MQIPSILSILPPTKSIAVITYDAGRLGPLHLQQLCISPSHTTDRILIRGAPAGGHLRSMIADGAPYIHAAIESELVQLVTDVIEEYDNIGAILLECTQMPPFTKAIQRSVGPEVPVYDVYTMGCWFYSGLVRRRPAAWGEVE